MRALIFGAGLLGLMASIVIASNEHTVVQKNLAFDRSTMTIKVGDTVKFENADPEFHNIFSLSDAALFDLGSFGQGEARSHTFTAPGDVDVECAMHPDMRMTITVTE